MTKDEALKMAIEAMIKADNYFEQLCSLLITFGVSPSELNMQKDTFLIKPINACKEALEPTVAELNDEYLSDTHVEWLSTNSKANEIIKTQEPSYMYVYADGDFFIHSQSPIGAPAHWQYFGKIKLEVTKDEALTEQPTQDGDCCTEGCIKCDARCLPTQEPVAWYWDNHHRDKIPYVGVERGNPKLDAIFGTPMPLYTHPKQWQGLSNEEVTHIGMSCQSLHQVARAIDAKLREKNT